MALIVISTFAVEVAAICGALVMTVRGFRINNQVKRYIDAEGTLTGVMRVVPFGVLLVSIADPWRYLPREAANLVSRQRWNSLFWFTFCSLGVVAGVALDFLTQPP
jgi:hypothetical protein